MLEQQHWAAHFLASALCVPVQPCRDVQSNEYAICKYPKVMKDEG